MTWCGYGENGVRIQRGCILLCFALLQLVISETGRAKSWSLSWKEENQMCRCWVLRVRFSKVWIWVRSTTSKSCESGTPNCLNLGFIQLSNSLSAQFKASFWRSLRTQGGKPGNLWGWYILPISSTMLEGSSPLSAITGVVPYLVLSKWSKTADSI